MGRFWVFVAGLVVSSLASGEARADTIYVSDVARGLHAYDTATNAFTFIGTTSVGSMPDIALNSAGELFGVSSQRSLYRINTTNAAVSAVGPTHQSLNALAFDQAGTLFASSEFGGLYTVDTSTGDATLINAIRAGSVQYFSSGDLAFNLAGELFMSTTSRHLVKVDPTNGNATLIGAHGIPDLYGLAFASDGTLHGFDRRGLFWTIDTNTAARTFAGYPGPTAFGAASNPFPSSGGGGGTDPVPEPGTWALFGAVLVAGAVARRRNKRD